MARTEGILVAGRLCVADGQNVLQLSFSAPFLCFFLWAFKERKKNKERGKCVQRADPQRVDLYTLKKSRMGDLGVSY
jgi:hypothetical protein